MASEVFVIAYNII